MDLRVGGDNVAKQGFCALHVDGKIVVNDKYGHLAAFAFGALLQQEQFVDHAFIRAKADGITEKAGDGAELASIGASAPRFHRDNSECAPARANLGEQRMGELGNEVELRQVDRIPGNSRIGLQRWLALLSEIVQGRIDLLEISVGG